MLSICQGRTLSSHWPKMQLDCLMDSVETPAFVYDEGEVSRVLDIARVLQADTGCRVLYSIKPLCLSPLLEMMAPQLAGFAVSSPFEALLARGVLARGGSIHFTSPGIRPQAADELAKLCDYVAFNSLSQWRRHWSEFSGRASMGLRVNPGLSFLEDERYDPSRPHSKLGIPVEQLTCLASGDAAMLSSMKGILIHTNCESTNFAELRQTVDCLEDNIPEALAGLNWINLGGGYLFNEDTDLEPLRQVIHSLRSRYGVEVFLEPGAAFVRSAGYIISTVLDVFASGGRDIAVLDTSVNHMPELLEFDFEPDVAGHDEGGPWAYILAGCTCLAGDVFGEYRFRQPLEVGDRLAFLNAGSYSLAKAQTFNGVNLPTIYSMDRLGRSRLVKGYTYQDYAARWEANVRHSI